MNQVDKPPQSSSICILQVVRNNKLVFKLSVISLSTASTTARLKTLVLNPLELLWKNAQGLKPSGEFEVKEYPIDTWKDEWKHFLG